MVAPSLNAIRTPCAIRSTDSHHERHRILAALLRAPPRRTALPGLALYDNQLAFGLEIFLDREIGIRINPYIFDTKLASSLRKGSTYLCLLMSMSTSLYFRLVQ
jgi:hypothetical protein